MIRAREQTRKVPCGACGRLRVYPVNSMPRRYCAQCANPPWSDRETEAYVKWVLQGVDE